MHTTTRNIIERLISETDRERICITCTEGSLRRELSRLAKKGQLVSPWRGLYADANLWKSLKRPERQRRIIRTLARKYPD